MNRLAAVSLLTLASLAAASGMSGLRAQAPPLEHRWRGRIDQTVRLPTSTGEITHTFGFDVVWRERQVDVVDGARVVGQLTVLTDDGSRWSGTSRGLLKTDVTTSTASGSSSGTGQPVTAWVYQSRVPDDPARDLDGAYGFASAGSGAQIQTTITMTSPLGTHASTVATGTQFHAGGSMLYPVTPQPTLAATDLRRIVLEGRALAPKVAAVDREPRVLAEGAMTGSYRYTHPPGGMIIDLAWSIRRRLNLEGTLTEAPEAWRPILAGEPVEFTAALDASLGLKGRFRFTLFDVSRNPGYAMNRGEGEGLDLRFSDDQPVELGARTQTGDGWIVETTGAHQQAAIRVVAFDYGAWGRLKAEVEIDGEWYACTPAGGGEAAAVPLDQNNNRVADGWERDAGLSRMAADGDVDSAPAGAGDGDGLSNYEEYRGFFVGNTWMSLDPTQKEVFIRDVHGIGVGFFAASGVVPLLIDADEWDEATRVVNVNRRYASAGAQRGLRLSVKSLGVGEVGMVSPAVGTPNQVQHVWIDKADLDAIGGDALDSTIAHELGHAVSVDHHGHWEVNTCGTGTEERLIALWGGAHAGDQQCVMAYSGASFYKRRDRACRPYTWAPVWGATFCRSPLGTGVNAGPERTDAEGHPMPVSGNASRGNCAAQIRLK